MVSGEYLVNLLQDVLSSLEYVVFVNRHYPSSLLSIESYSDGKILYFDGNLNYDFGVLLRSIHYFIPDALRKNFPEICKVIALKY